ncbi:MAG: tRNA (adenosine(37)-N6)-threonylcarbamoyltransferase complex ATPase subunit type 1 TsaE [Clostridia bacterium]|nr:tRNA (adenosine(37)-N6)-threonylcarbamoyltransferase complex ATPase subunit type 1 TsaE [Clostridia bacterium]
MEKYISDSDKKTAKFAKKLAKTCKKGDILLLYGDLGAGKTVFAKGFVSHFSRASVVSPTFTIVNTYPGKTPVYHFDLYRIENPAELEQIGFEDYLYGGGICLIEWPEKAQNYQFENAKVVKIIKIDEDTREIVVGD